MAQEYQGVWFISKVGQKIAEGSWVPGAIPPGPIPTLVSGWWGSGYPPSATNVEAATRLGKVVYASDIYSVIGTVNTRWWGAGVSSPTRGYFAGGYSLHTSPINTNQYISNIDSITYASDTQGDTFRAYLSSARIHASGCGNATYGWFNGAGANLLGTVSVPFGQQFDRLTFAADSLNATLRASCPNIHNNGAAISNGTYGYWATGDSTSGQISAIDRLDFANDTANTTFRTNLVAVRSNGSAFADATYGWFTDGNGPGPLNQYLNKFSFINDTAAAVQAAALNQNGGNRSAANLSYAYIAGGQIGGVSMENMYKYSLAADYIVTSLGSVWGAEAFGVANNPSAGAF